MFAARILIAGIAVALIAIGAAAQRVAVITPDDSDGSRAFASKLKTSLAGKGTVVDDALAKSAFDAAGFAAPYNLSLEEAKHAGQAVGCDFLVLVRSAVQRRSSFEREEYYDAYASLFLVSARTGRLVSRPFLSELADKPAEAEQKLDSKIRSIGESLLASVRSTARIELDEKPPPPMEEPPSEDPTAAKNFKAPVPFQRIKPEYTALADQYEVTATVDIAVDLDAEGHIIRSEITRWAGYDLDESVDKAVRSMNWRPAERDGKFIPMRFLVRYNFKKAEKPARP